MKANINFWEIPAASDYFDRLSVERGLWFESQVDRDRRYALQEFFQAVTPAVGDAIATALTPRQKEVVLLYFYYGKTQEDIAAILSLAQSTVSRHLFGTTRNGKKVGGAVQKLRKVIERTHPEPVQEALDTLQERFQQVV
jgi:predicted transcriptional regulator